MLRKKDLLSKIAGSLAQLKACVELHNEIRFFDLNIACEDFFVSLLNSVYEYSLVNLNHSELNSVAIDLGDTGNRLAVQVTSERRKAKVQNTIDSFAENGLGARYSTLKILIIGNRTGDYNNLRLPSGIHFNGKADVIDIPRLMRDIRDLPTSRLEQIALLLRQETSNDNHASDSIAHQGVLDIARDLVNADKPHQAFTFLSRQRSAIWPSASRPVRARLLGILACAQCRLGETQTAATLYLEARQYDPCDEKVLCNVALGYYLLGENSSATALSNQVLERNPANFQAHSILIQISNEPLDVLVNTLPEFVRDNHEVAFAIGALAQRRGDLTNALKWFQVAIDKSAGGTPQIKGTFGEAIVQSFTANPVSPIRIGQVDAAARSKIEYAAKLLKEACDAYSEDEVLRTRTTWLLNADIAYRMLDDPQAASSFLNLARRLDPKHPLVVYRLAVDASNRGDYNSAIAMVRTISNAVLMPDQPLYLGQLLLENGQYSEAAETLQEFLATKPSEPSQSSAKQLLAEVYINCRRFRDALQIVDDLLALRPDDVWYLVMASQIYRQMDRRKEADASLEKSVHAAICGTPVTHLFTLANELATQQQWDGAAEILGRIVDETQDSPLTRNLINAYYRSSKLDKALDLCRKLRSSNGPLEAVTEIEIAILEETGNLKEARLVLSQFIASFPEALKWHIHLAVLCFREDDMVALDAILASPPDWKDLPVQCGQQLAQLLWVRGRVVDAIGLLYEMRRVHPVGAVQLQYIQMVLFDCDKHNLTNPDVVEVDAAVSVKDSAGSCQWYVIENREGADVSKGELHYNHRLAQQLLGKAAGDSVVLKESPFSTEMGTVVAIKNKYIHAFHETAQGYEVRYPDAGGFISMSFEDGQNGFDELCGKLAGQHAKRLDQEERAESTYRSSPSTVGTLAKLLHLDVIQAWAHLANRKGSRIFCSTGLFEVRQAASQLEKPGLRLVIDPVSLMTIQGLQMADEVFAATGLLGIAQTTVDLVTELMHKKVRVSRRRFITTRDRTRGNTRSDVTFVTEISFESILEWIKAHCIVLPWSPANVNKREARVELEQLIGIEALDSILCSCEPTHVLYSDDLRLRRLAKQHFDVDSASTNSVLLQALAKGVIDRARYNRAIVQLASANYCQIDISASVLVEAARQADWASDGTPFTDVLWLLNPRFCGEDMAIGIVADFARLLWDTSVLPMIADGLIFRMLDELAIGRSAFRVGEKMLLALSARFAVIPLAAMNYSKLVLMWRRLRG